MTSAFTMETMTFFFFFFNFTVVKENNRVLSLGQEDTLEKKMATHSSILAWEIPWIEETGGLQSTESQRAGHN